MVPGASPGKLSCARITQASTSLSSIVCVAWAAANRLAGSTEGAWNAAQARTSARSAASLAVVILQIKPAVLRQTELWASGHVP
eukprot:1011699-Prymnesium_polylepis.1